MRLRRRRAYHPDPWGTRQREGNRLGDNRQAGIRHREGNHHLVACREVRAAGAAAVSLQAPAGIQGAEEVDRPGVAGAGVECRHLVVAGVDRPVVVRRGAAADRRGAGEVVAT